MLSGVARKLFSTLKKNLYALLWHHRYLEVMQESYLLNLLQQERYRDPKRLNQFENQCFSQHGQDGIIREIFQRIGVTDKTFVEIGSGDGSENNSTYLLAKGWKGFWIDGSASNIQSAEKQFAKPLSTGALKTRQAFITRENIADILHDLKVPVTFDFLSVDIDRNTYYVLEPLASFQPQVIAVEYNSSYLAGDEWVVDYDPNKIWNFTNYIGASLKSIELLMNRLGYNLVGCETIGVDAFFVRKDLTKNLFCQPYTAENHYEPPRFFLIRKQGHTPCFSDSVS